MAEAFPKCDRRPLVLVLLLALAVRLALLGANWGNCKSMVFERSWPDDTLWYRPLDRECRVLTPDSNDYLHLAVQLVEKREFRRVEFTPSAMRRFERPEIFRTPGYPGFLAAVFALGGGVRAAVIVQILLDVLLCAMVYLLARRLLGPALTRPAADLSQGERSNGAARSRGVPESLTGKPPAGHAAEPLPRGQACPPYGSALTRPFGPTSPEGRGVEGAALWAALFQAVSPAVVVSSVRVLSESIFALLLTACLLLVLEVLREPRRLWLAAPAGLLAAAACLVRPIGQFFIFIPALVMLARPGWRRVFGPLVFFACAALPVSAWIVRNYVVTDRQFLGLSSVAQVNLYWYNARLFAKTMPDDPTVKSLVPPWFTRGSESIDRMLGVAPESNNPAQVTHNAQTGLRIIAAHPLSYALFHLRTTMNCFLPAATDVLEVLGITSGNQGTLAVLQQEGLQAAARHYFGGQVWPMALAAPMLLFLLVKYACIVVGVIRQGRWWLSAEGWLAGLTILYFVLAPGPVAHARFRVPIEPLLSVLAAAGVAWVVNWRRRRSRA